VEDRISSRPWIVVGILTVLWHLLLFLVPWQRIFVPNAPLQPAKIDIQSVTPDQLENIRKQWREKSLLLNKDQAPNEKEAPPDAKYMSEKNRRVEKEQRAARTNVIPKPGTAAVPQAQDRPVSRPHPSLSRLGVPLRLGRTTPRTQAAPQEEGGDQAIREKDLPLGSENILNTQQSIYYSFYSRLYEAIGPVWQSRIREVPYSRRVAPGEYTTQVEVLLDRSGNLAEIRFHKSSGVPEFDQAVDASWRRLGKFPNPPMALIEADGTVHTAWTFTVEVGENFNLQYLPPKRNY
jgi:TonB family protein